MIISRINGFTYCKTEFDPYTETVTVTEQKAYSNGPRADVKCYGADNVPEGVAIMKLENVGVPSPATPPTRPASSIRSQAPTRSGASRTASTTSPSLPAAARAAPCIPTTWRPAPPATA